MFFYKSTSQEIRQAAEKEQLPEELTDLNPMKIYRLVNGVRTKEAIKKNND